MIKVAIQKLGINQLNAMQNTAIAASREQDDIILLSPTGSGKTLAFLLPLLEKMDHDRLGIQAIIIVPSRELAMQIEQVFRKLQSGFKVNCCYGGHSFKTEQQNLSESPALLIGTPGRLSDHIRRESFDPTPIRYLILDEFDKSLELGFQKDISFIVKKLLLVEKQTLTSASDSLKIPDFLKLKNPNRLNFLSKTENPGLSLKIIKTKEAEKLDGLFALLCHINTNSSLVFCNHRDAVERISKVLQQKGIHHGLFHGKLEQEDRERNLVKFRNGSFRTLICTDLAARGLDIPEIDTIIHYQLPHKSDSFLHRNGRTARMHATGNSYLVFSEADKWPDYLDPETETLELPEKFTIPQNSDWTTLYIGGGKKDKINKVDIVGLMFKKGQLDKGDLGLIEVKDKFSYAAVKTSQAQVMIKKLHGERIKKKKVKIEIAR